MTNKLNIISVVIKYTKLSFYVHKNNSKRHVSGTWRFCYQYENHWDQTHKFILQKFRRKLSNSKKENRTTLCLAYKYNDFSSLELTEKWKTWIKIETYTEQVMTWNVNVIACRRGTDRVVLVQVVATGRVVGLGRTTTTEWRTGPLKAATSHQQIHMLQAPHSRF